MYGEDAWDAYAEEKYRKQSRQYAKEHKEEQKEYYQEHKERIAEQRKQYYQEHKEEYKEYRKQYYQDNKEYYAEYYKRYFQENKEQYAEQMKQYYSTQWGRAIILKNSYIQTDKEKGFSTDQVVDADWIVENIFNSSCIYCGERDWTKLGCDRIDNTKPHTPDNVVCACWDCNKERRNRFTVEEFQLIKRNTLAP